MNKTKAEFRKDIETIRETLNGRKVKINIDTDIFYFIFYHLNYYVIITELNDLNVLVSTFFGGHKTNSYSIGYDSLSAETVEKLVGYVKEKFTLPYKTVLLNSDIDRIFPFYENLIVEDKDGGQYYITHDELTKAVKQHCNFVIEKKRKRSWLTAGLPK